MDVYDIFMLATGTAALYVYLTIACSQLRLRQKIEASGQKLEFKMWLFPGLTYAVIFTIVGAIIAMLIEGTYFKEVIYTSGLALFIVILGVCAQKFNWGKEQQAALKKKRILAKDRINPSASIKSPHLWVFYWFIKSLDLSDLSPHSSKHRIMHHD